MMGAYACALCKGGSDACLSIVLLPSTALDGSRCTLPAGLRARCYRFGTFWRTAEALRRARECGLASLRSKSRTPKVAFYFPTKRMLWAFADLTCAGNLLGKLSGPCVNMQGVREEFDRAGSGEIQLEDRRTF